MKAIPALIWKELKECQWALIAGGALFVAMPTLVTVLLAGRVSGLGDVAFGLVLGLGGLYAILVGVHGASSDLRPGLEPFWRSRPIGVTGWTAVKYLLGGAVVLLVTASALVIEAILVVRWGLGSPGDQLAMLLGHSFTLLLVYSAAFLSGSLVGEPLKAALLSLAGGVLLYFLPVILPPLEHWSVISLLGDWPRPRQIDSQTPAGFVWLDWVAAPADLYGPFALGHVALSAVMGSLACAAVRFRWRIEPGQKTLVFALGGVVMALLALAGEQIGSNLELRAVHEHSPGTRDCAVVRIDQSGGAGIFARFHWPERGIDWYALSLQKFDLSESPPRFEAPVEVPGKFRGSGGWSHELRIAWTPDHPDRAYLLIEAPTSREEEEALDGARSAIDLVTLDLDPGSRTPVLHRLELLAHLPGSRSLDRVIPWPHVRRGILYIADAESNPNTKVLRIDLRNPDAPVLIDVLEIRRAVFQLNGEGGPKSRGLLEIPGLDARERLEATFALQGVSPGQAVHGTFPHDAFNWFLPRIDGYLLVTWDHRKGLETHEIDLSSADRALFKKLGQRRPTPLERLRHLGPGAAFLRDGLYYALSHDGMTVYDLRDPARPRRIGHYAAPREDFRAIVPLPSGDVLVAGRSLHVVAPPRTERRDRP